jgi:hypothetical protein
VAAEVAAAGKDWDAECPVNHEWAQISNPHGRTISKVPEAHIALTAKDPFKAFVADKAEVREISVRASSRTEAAEVSKVEARQSKVEAAEVSSVEISPPRAGE